MKRNTRKNLGRLYGNNVHSLKLVKEMALTGGE